MAHEDKKQQIISELKHSFFMELETVFNYVANSAHLDGVRAEEIRKSLAADVPEELRHAQLLAKRLKVLDAAIPGSLEMQMEQRTLQPPADMTDVVSVIHGVIDAEQGAIDQYKKIIQICEGIDYVTQELAINLLSDEEEHHRLFKGFLMEYERETKGKPERVRQVA